MDSLESLFLGTSLTSSPSYLFWCHVILNGSGSGTRQSLLDHVQIQEDGTECLRYIKIYFLPGTPLCARSTSIHLPHEPADAGPGGISGGFYTCRRTNYTPEKDVGGKAVEKVKKKKKTTRQAKKEKKLRLVHLPFPRPPPERIPDPLEPDFHTRKKNTGSPPSSGSPQTSNRRPQTRCI